MCAYMCVRALPKQPHLTHLTHLTHPTLPSHSQIYSIAARRRAGDNAIGGPLKKHTMAALIALALYGAVSSVLGTKAALKNS